MDSTKHHDAYYKVVLDKVPHSDIPTNIVYHLIHDLTNRRGLRQQFDEIDPETQDELVDTWIDIVRKDLK